MSSIFSSLPSNNILMAGAAVIGTAVAVAGIKVYNKLNSADYKARETFKKLLITDWFLPQKGETLVDRSDIQRPKPIFNTKTVKEIAAVREMILKARENDGRSPIPNLIFVGKAGVGKTMVAENLCRDSGIGYIRIPSGAMENHLKTATHITALHEVFAVAESSATPVYIIMDDGEELVAQRPDEVKVEENDTTKAYWLKEREKTGQTILQRRIALVNATLEASGKDVRKIAFAITTNRPEVIDRAFITRARVIAIDPPTMDERKNIIITHLPTIFNGDPNYLSFFNKGRLEDMALKTEGFTGRNLVKMLEAIFACVQLENGDITQEIIDGCIVDQAKSVEALQYREPVQAEFKPQVVAAPARPVAQQPIVDTSSQKISFSVWVRNIFPCC